MRDIHFLQKNTDHFKCSFLLNYFFPDVDYDEITMSNNAILYLIKLDENNENSEKIRKLLSVIDFVNENVELYQKKVVIKWLSIKLATGLFYPEIHYDDIADDFYFYVKRKNKNDIKIIYNKNIQIKKHFSTKINDMWKFLKSLFKINSSMKLGFDFYFFSPENKNILFNKALNFQEVLLTPDMVNEFLEFSKNTYEFQDKVGKYILLIKK